MDAEEKTKFVIQEMKRYRKLDDIIFDLCEASGSAWPETAAFVRQVAAANRDKVEASRRPLIAAIGIASIIAGLGAMVGVALATLEGWVVFFLAVPVPYLGNAVLFLFGLAIMFGGAVGLLQMVIWPTRHKE